MKTIIFFNNKGGVGKTTLSANIASYLALEMNKRILIVDADPQSNTTQLMLNEEQLIQIYDNSEEQTTLLSFLKPLDMGEPSIDLNHNPLPGDYTKYGVDLIPGHPKLSFIEDRLSDSWSKCNAGDIGGFRVTNWVSVLKNNFSDQYDYIIFDVGPALSALNRSILLNSDYFITPMGCDIFSLIGIENISSWITLWRGMYEDALNALKRRNPHFDFSTYYITNDLSNNFRFIGFSVNHYITKVIRGQKRAIKAYETIKLQIPTSIKDKLSFLLPENLSIEMCDLGGIPNYFSLVPLSQTSKCPIHQLTKSDGIIGNQYSMVKDYKSLMDNICKKILENVGENKT